MTEESSKLLHVYGMFWLHNLESVNVQGGMGLFSTTKACLFYISIFYIGLSRAGQMHDGNIDREGVLF